MGSLMVDKINTCACMACNHAAWHPSEEDEQDEKKPDVGLIHRPQSLLSLPGSPQLTPHWKTGPALSIRGWMDRWMDDTPPCQPWPFPCPWFCFWSPSGQVPPVAWTPQGLTHLAQGHLQTEGPRESFLGSVPQTTFTGAPLAPAGGQS